MRFILVGTEFLTRMILKEKVILGYLLIILLLFLDNWCDRHEMISYENTINGIWKN